MNLGNLIDRAQELADRKDTAWDARVRNWINEGIRAWGDTLPWPTLRRIQDFTFNSREDTARILTLPQHTAKVLRVADQTNSRPLIAGNQPDLDLPLMHLQNTSGLAFQWRELGVSATHNQPAVASTINVRSTVSDVHTVYLAGLAMDTSVSGTPDEQFWATEEISVSSSGVHTSSTLFLRLDTIGKSKEVAAGDVIIDDGTDRLARIRKDEFRTEYRQIELIGAPLDGTIFQIEFLLKPPSLRNTNDVAPPAVSSDYLIWYAASMIQRAQSNVQEAEILLGNADEVLDRIAKQEKNAGDQDWRAMPEPRYWANEDQYIWPIP